MTVFVMNADGSGRMPLTANDDAEDDPDWQPIPVNCSKKMSTLVGTEGTDKLVGTTGADVISGLAGKDDQGPEGQGPPLWRQGEDKLIGGPAPDRLLGGKGRDVVKGGGGKDVEKPEPRMRLGGRQLVPARRRRAAADGGEQAVEQTGGDIVDRQQPHLPRHVDLAAVLLDGGQDSGGHLLGRDRVLELRQSGSCSASACRSVATSPGKIVLSETPVPESSWRSASANPLLAALWPRRPLPRGRRAGRPRLTTTMWPRPRSSIGPRPARTVLIVPVTLVRTIRSASSGSCSKNGAYRATPALATSRSSPPARSTKEAVADLDLLAVGNVGGNRDRPVAQLARQRLEALGAARDEANGRAPGGERGSRRAPDAQACARHERPGLRPDLHDGHPRTAVI